jgi:hypothetical protein
LISTPSGGSSLITNSNVVKGLKTNSPITLTDASNLLTLGLDKVALANDFEVAFTAIAPLQKGINLQTGELTLKLQDNLGEILADHVDTIGDVVVGDAVLTDNIRANGENAVTIGDNLVVTGNLTVNGSLINYNPFWVSGRVNGTNLSILKSNGKYGFTVTRHPDFPAGVYRITFDTPAPDANYVISLAQFGNGNIKVWEATLYGGPPTTTRFHAVTYNTSWVLANFDFYFSIFV